MLVTTVNLLQLWEIVIIMRYKVEMTKKNVAIVKKKFVLCNTKSQLWESCNYEKVSEVFAIMVTVVAVKNKFTS